MNETIPDVQYELPRHRMKILGTIIIGLTIFLVYQLSTLNSEISFLDFLLIPIIIFLLFLFKAFLARYSNVGFLINEIGLFNLDKSLICKIEDIEKVDVSPYTFKAANGFIVLLKTKNSFKAIPGLYWRLGKRISIGGLISKSESKFLSGTLLEILNKKTDL